MLADPVVGEMLEAYAPAGAAEEKWAWLRAAGAAGAGGAGGALPAGRLDFERAPREVRDGLFSLVVPLLRARFGGDAAPADLRVQYRERAEVRTDIRVSLEPRGAAAQGGAGGRKVTQWRSTG